MKTINLSGNIISREIIELADRDLAHQAAGDFGFSKNTRLGNEIGAAWSAAQHHWKAFDALRKNRPEDETLTSQTRAQWAIPLLGLLGYDLEFNQKGHRIGDKTYAISHAAPAQNNLPVHVVGARQNIDRRDAHTATRISPHALVQEYLNNTDEHLYGLVTNGLQLRLLRDNSRLSQVAYVEFNLEQIFEEDSYADFVILFRLLHSSRMPQTGQQPEKCVLEDYHQLSLDSGARIKDKLRNAFHQSLLILGRGLLEQLSVNSEPVNSAEKYFSFLQQFLYRLLFLMVAEERGLIFPAEKQDEQSARFAQIYEEYYSIRRLRYLAENRIYVSKDDCDLFESLKSTFALFETPDYGAKLGITALAGSLFSEQFSVNNEQFSLRNADLLKIISLLSFFEDESHRQVRVNYGELSVEEFGSVYEGLLELKPEFVRTPGGITFRFTEGSERKLSGSYYTRHDLVAQLVKTALLPVIEERLAAAKTPEAKEAALLKISVCDPAAGSGHFLLAAAQALAFELAKIRSGEEQPGEKYFWEAKRDVISHCIYGVDLNPAAVELCKVALWIESHNPGRALNFLDDKIRCGNALIGIDNLERLQKGIPDGAFEAGSGEHKPAAREAKRLNKTARAGQKTLFADENVFAATARLAAARHQLDSLDVATAADYARKAQTLQRQLHDSEYLKLRGAADLFTYAFFQPFQEDESTFAHFVTSEDVQRAFSFYGDSAKQTQANITAQQMRFFHWPLEFPEIFDNGGFDVMLGNPPWEVNQLNDAEFFDGKDQEIANEGNSSSRKRMIDLLQEANPELYQEYHRAKVLFEKQNYFFHGSGRFDLSARGKINFYATFCEMFSQMIRAKARAGFIVPTGIATDDSTKVLFGTLVENTLLYSLFDFENRKGIFPNVHRSFKFCLMTLIGSNSEHNTDHWSLSTDHCIRLAFFLEDPLQLSSDERIFTLTPRDFALINPNTKTCPLFRTRQDADLTAKIYRRFPVLINEAEKSNPWEVKFRQGLFNMSTASHLFKTRAELEQEGYVLHGNVFIESDVGAHGGAPNDDDAQNDSGRAAARPYDPAYLPLYESKMFHQFDHRFGSYEENDERGASNLFTPSETQHQDPDYSVMPWYWIDADEVKKKTEEKYFLAFRNIARNTDERTLIASFLPWSGVGNSAPVMFLETDAIQKVLFIAMISSLVFDYVVRQKLGGTNMNFHYVEQFPVLPPETFTPELTKVLLPPALELIYTSWDLKPLMDDVVSVISEQGSVNSELREAIMRQWRESVNSSSVISDAVNSEQNTDHCSLDTDHCNLPPFRWDEERRAELRAFLDAHFAKLYGLTRDELRYILDPADVYGEDFPGQTFAGLKRNEIREFGEYRTRRLVLEQFSVISEQ